MAIPVSQEIYDEIVALRNARQAYYDYLVGNIATETAAMALADSLRADCQAVIDGIEVV